VLAKYTPVYARKYNFLDGQLGSITVSCEAQLTIVWKMCVRVFSFPCAGVFSEFP
jgi:hypothetical protein